jgi:hypothetical protein
LGIGVLEGCRASAPVGDTSTTAGPRAFCEQLLALNQMGAPERGGNRADELSELLAVSDDRIADAVETFGTITATSTSTAMTPPTPTTASPSMSAKRSTGSTTTTSDTAERSSRVRRCSPVGVMAGS